MNCEIHHGDALEVLRTLPSESVQCCVTSPPYWGLRDYGVAGQIGLEKTPEEFIAKLVEVFREVRRVLKGDGTCWVNMGDAYTASGCGWSNTKDSISGANRLLKDRDKTKDFSRSKRLNRGSGRWGGGNAPAAGDRKNKDLVGIPWMLAFALRADGWWLRQDIIWSKPNPMPESVRDRCTKSHEYIFLLSKSARYFYDAGAIAEALAYSSVARLNQDVAAQNGSPVPFKTNGNMKACQPSSYKGSSFKEGKTAAQRPNVGTGVRAELDLRNKRSVWQVSTKNFSEAHFATFPPEIPETCIKAGSREGDTILDPFCGAGTTGMVALRLNRNFIGAELNAEYRAMALRRITDDAPLLNHVTEEAAKESQLLLQGD